MGLYTTLPDGIQEVDIIISGGMFIARESPSLVLGKLESNLLTLIFDRRSCWFVVAARLSDADPNLSILVIEGGQNNETPTIEHPAFFMAHLVPESTKNQYLITKGAQK